MHTWRSDKKKQPFIQDPYFSGETSAASTRNDADYITAADTQHNYLSLHLNSAHVTCYFFSVLRRHQATHHERAHAPAPSGGTAGRARLYCGDAHPQRCSNCGLLRRSVHTGDPREGQTHEHKDIAAETFCLCLINYNILPELILYEYIRTVLINQHKI